MALPIGVPTLDNSSHAPCRLRGSPSASAHYLPGQLLGDVMATYIRKVSFYLVRFEQALTPWSATPSIVTPSGCIHSCPTSGVPVAV